MNDLKKRILEISYKKGLAHLGSCLTAYPIIEEIYKIKKPNEKFILSAGHSALALYCVLEARGGRNAEDIFNHHGVHPDRCSQCGLDYSCGSLGHGIGAAVGMALADRAKGVYCLLTDGECAEGSVFEALRIAGEQKLNNLKVYVNCNSYGAYGEIDVDLLEKRLHMFFPVEVVRTDVNQLPFLKNQGAHYYKMTEADYEMLVQ